MSDRIHCSECVHLRPFPELPKLDRDDVAGAAEQSKEMARRNGNSGQCALAMKDKPQGMVRGDQHCERAEVIAPTPEEMDRLELPGPVEPAR